MEMMDMGKKQESCGESPTIVNNTETKISYPSFSISEDKIPEEMGNMKSGEKCRCEIIVRKVGDNIDTYTKGEPRRIEVEIHKLGCMDSKVSEDEYKDMTDAEKDKADEKDVLGDE